MRWVTLLLICFGFLGSSEVMAQQPVERHLQIQGIEREYLVLDTHHQQQQPAPLVLVLHGGGGNASRMIKRWQSVAEREGLIVIAPNAQAATWNAGGCCGQAQQQQSADAAFIQSLLQIAQQQYPVNSHRIYIVGFSNGEMLTYQLVAQKKTPFAAAAVVSAAMFVGQEQPQASMPLLIVHGLKDRVVPIGGGMSQVRFVARLQSQAFLPLQQTLERWQKTNQCQSKTQSDSKQFEVWSYKSCKADLQVYLLKEEGHTWVEAEDENQFDSTEAVWKFLKQHRKQ